MWRQAVGLSSLLRVQRQDIQSDREEMEGAAAEDAEVPGGVEEFPVVEGVEHGAGGVGEATADEEKEAAEGESVEEGDDDEDGEPSHEEVEAGGEGR